MKEVSTLFSPLELYERVIPYLSSDLVSGDSVARILKFVALLPETLPLKHFGFECPLNRKNSQNQTDIAMDLNLEGDLLKDSVQLDSLPISLQEDELWRHFSLLTTRFLHEKHFRKHEIQSYWLEFDLESDLRWPPAPNWQFDYSHKAGGNEILSSLDFLQNNRLANRIAKINACAQAFNLRLRVIAFMPGRDPEWTKIIVQYPKREKKFSEIFDAFLEQVSYPYPRVELIRMIERVEKLSEHLCLQIDMREKIEPRIGIECLFSWRTPIDKWAPLLEFLISQGLMTQKERVAIDSWRGGTAYMFNGQRHRLIRATNHIKISYHPGSFFQAKAYPGAICLSRI